MTYRYLFAPVLLLFFAVSGHSAFAQTPVCGNVFFGQNPLFADSILLEKHAAQDAAAYKFFSENSPADAAPALVTVPVVVHLMHNNGPENLSDAQVQQAIQWLNDAFANDNFYDQGSGADVPIRFCLASRAPDGAATAGINRVQTPLTELNMDTDDGELKALIRWPPTRYVNLWIVRSICSDALSCGVSGYAAAPFYHGSASDGIVLEADFFGGSPALTSPLVHEMGHYFGLYHTFEGGCANADCLADGDRVCDTPPEQSTAGLPCDQTANTCSTDAQSGLPADLPDDTHNFLDYGNAPCRHDFTPGQSARMVFFLENARQSLLTSDGCGAPCLNLVTAEFTPGALIVDLGATVTFTNQSQNAAAFVWTVNGTPFSNAANAGYLFDQEGAFVVALTAVSADPGLCPAQTASVVVQVLCPAQADFQASDLEVFTGATVTFTNTSTGATTFEWFVNGASQGPTLDSYTFTQAGSFAIKLTAGNGLCERSKTLVVLVRDSCKSQSFQKIFGTAADERGAASAVLTDGNLLVGGDGYVPGGGRDLLFVKTDADGNPLWTRHFGDPSGDEFLQDLLPTAGGGFVALFTGTAWNSGRDASAAAFSSDGDLLWQRRLASPGDDELRRLRPAADGGFFAVGFVRPAAPDTLARAYFLKFDAAGAQQWAWSFGLPGQSCFATDLVATADSGYAASGYYQAPGDIRYPLMLRLDPNGAVLRARTLGNPVDGALWNVHRITSPLNDGLIFTGEQTDGYQTGLFISTDYLNSSTPGGGQYGVPNALPMSFRDGLIAANDELVAIADAPNPGGPNEAFFLRNNYFNGITYWTRRYAGLGDSRTERVCALPGGGYLFTGSTSGPDGNRQLYWLKTGENGLAGACPESSAPVSTTFLSDQLVAVDLLPAAALPWENVAASSAQPYALESAPLCAPQCAALPCKTAWVQYFDQVGVEWLTAVVPAPDGTFYAGGRRNNRTLLLNFAPDGTVFWARQFDFSSRNDRLSDLLLDSDGHLVGVGGGEIGGVYFVGYAFKYDPLADAVLWVQEEAEVKRSRFVSVLEIAPGGNYLVNAFYPTGPPVDPDNDPVLLELDRNTGELAAGGIQRTFDFDKNESFQMVKRHGDAFFAVGKIETPADPQHPQKAAVCKFDLAGNEIWTRFLAFPGAGSSRLEAVDLEFDGDSLLVAVHGDFDGLDELSEQFALVKMDADGAVLWSKIYTQQFSAGAFELRNLVAAPDGFYLVEKDFIVKIGPDGALRWVRGPGVIGLEGRRLLAERDGFAYVVGARYDGTQDLGIARLQGVNGDLGESCFVSTNIPLAATALTGVSAPSFDWLVYANPLLLAPRAAVPESVDPGEQFFPCGAPCFERCDNGVSDDYDRLADCFDPTCDCRACSGETARIWYFGQHAGLDFNTEPPTVLTGGATDATGATAAACDENGRLLFYTDGATIFNRDHQPMPAAMGLLGGPAAASTLIFPAFTSNFIVLTPGDDPSAQHYSVVDMSRDNGLGDLYRTGPAVGNLYKNRAIPQVLSNVELDKFAAVKRCTFGDWWVVNKKGGGRFFQINIRSGPEVLFWDTLSAGTPVILPDGSQDNRAGQMKFDRSGRRLANALPGSGGFDLLDFNLYTGVLTDGITVLLPELAGAHGLEFSPNNRFLYVSTPLRVFQFDLVAGDATAVANSRVLLAQSPTPRFGALQRGPNGKIYVATGAGAPSPALDVIFQPDLPGLACQYQQDAQPLGPGRVGLGLVNFPQSLVTPWVNMEIEGPDSICGAPTQVLYTLGQAFCREADSIHWEVAGGTVTSDNFDTFFVQFDQPGTAVITAYVRFPCGEARDTLTITILDGQAPSLDLGPDLVVCENGVFTLNAGGGFARYRWPDGSADSLFTTAAPGTYWVTAWDVCGNPQTDSVTISVNPATQLDLGPDQVVCRAAGAEFSLPADFTGWQWSPATGLACDTCALLTALPDQATDYVATARTADGCLSVDTVRVGADTLTALFDTTVCAGAAFDYLGMLLPATDTLLNLWLLTPEGCDLLLTADIATWPPVSVALPPDTTLKIGAVLTLAATTAGTDPLAFAWSPPDGLSCADCPAPEVTALTNITYTLAVTDANGCAAIDSIFLAVLDTCGVRAPTAFTPDGDGVNDSFFLLTDPCVRTVRALRIFTRWGEEVFRSENTPPNQSAWGWDGRAGGRDFPADVLLWTAEVEYFDGRRERVMGEVMLLR